MAFKVFMFVPAFGQQITTATFLTTHSLQQAFASKNIQASVSSVSFPDIGELRNMVTTIFYDATDATHLLFIDADMGFPPELVLDMLLFGEPVVGSCYPKRSLPVEWTPSGTGEAKAELRAGFMHVEGVGMGCTLIRRDAIATILQNYPEIVDNRIALHPAKSLLQGAGANRIIRAFDPIDIPDRGKLSEDLSFCVRWNQCGGKVWANVSHRVSHVGPFDFGACYLDHLAKQEADAAALSQVQEKLKAVASAEQRPMLQAAE